MSQIMSSVFATIAVTLHYFIQILVRICAKHCILTGKAGRRDCLDYSKETDSLEVEKLFPKDNPLPPPGNANSQKETIVPF